MKKLLTMLLCVLLVAGLLAGCGGDTQTPAAPSTGDAGDASTAAPPADAGDKVTVRFMVGGSAGELAEYEKAVAAFNEQSEGTFVEFVGLPGEGYNEKLIAELNSQNPPDCFYSEEASFGELNNSDALLDLAPYLAAAEYGLSLEDIPESIVDFFTMYGKTTGVPVDSNPMVLYYNVELFEELDIKSPQEYYDEGTWNFAAMQEVSEQFRDAGLIGFVYENWWGPLYSMMLSADTDIYAADGTTANFASSPRMKEGLEYLSSNVASGAFKFTRASDQANTESPDKLFMAGQSGMIYAGRWFVPDFVDIGFTWDVVPFPYYQQPGDLIAPVPSTPMVINAASQNPDNTWEFISFYCGAAGQEIRMADSGNAVPTIPGLESIVLTGTPEHAQYFLDARDHSFAYPREEATHPGLSDSYSDEIEMMLAGEQDVDTTLANMQAAADKALAG